ncbi:MAG: hypothetical protein KJ040_03770 [Gammaproteobacteria bacterium]|nr:hypothetical protein [Gammaproteobacteria bacterium]
MLEFALRNQGLAMLFSFALMTTADGRMRAVVPDLPDCELSGRLEQELLPRLRLLVEEEVTRLLMAGKPLPDTRHGAAPPDRKDLATARWLSLDINLAHLEALARHQRHR